MAITAACQAIEPTLTRPVIVQLAGAVDVARILAGVVALFLVATIFKFKNLKLQQKLCSVAVLMMLVDLGIIAGAYYTAIVSVRFTVVAVLPLLAAACTLLAKGRIRKDYDLIHDCERLR